MGFFRITGETEKPMPNHCVECDTPTMDIICDKCKKKEDHTKICDGCGEADCNGSCIAPVDEEPMSNCCTASFTYPGFPDSDTCSKCHEHADIDGNDSWDNNPDDGSWKGR